MTSSERVLAACAFQAPDRIPCFDSFWTYPDSRRARFGPPETLTDLEIRVPDETTFPSRARLLSEENGWRTEVDGWGATVRTRPGSYFSETLASAASDETDPASLRFEDPRADSRYLCGAADAAAAAEALRESKRRHCVFGKTGGPFLRTCFVRGEAQFLTEIASDPPRARALADRVADHLAAVGAEEIRRWDLRDTGIWIYDDMACNQGPLFSPRSFEKVFLPAYRRMIRAYREAGARYVFLHSDGDVRPLLDMLVDAGIDGLNPLERRAGMAIENLRILYPRLVLTGGMCNTDTLRRGPIEKVRDEARRIVDLGRDGGIVIGTHSLSPEIPVELFAAYREVCETYGCFRPLLHADDG